VQKLAQQADAHLAPEQRLRRWLREYPDILERLNLGDLNRVRRGVVYRLRWVGFVLLDLLKEVSLVRKALDAWRGFFHK